MGSSSVSCPSNNANVKFVKNWAQPFYSYAIRVPAQPRAMMVDGFELFTHATSGNQATLVTQLNLANAAGHPGTPVAVGKMTVPRTVGWHKTRFTRPVFVPANTRLYIAFRKTSGSMYFSIDGRSGATLATHYWGTSAWRGPFKVAEWNYKLICRQAPELNCIGVPAIGRMHVITLSGAPPRAATFLAIGLNRRNPGWQWPGAPGCYLHVKQLFVFPFMADSSGEVRVKEPVPNDTSLIGKTFTHQFAVIDRVNSAGIVFSEAGEVKL